ncbi:hypothetical protein ACVW1B_000297 [Bradyrhizobium sp. USDA 4502]|nr:hypothetical protein [Bradyrhizobium sp. USDA 4538]MCP1899156.1 hypothetical protein [Bradyrhizobium sp. USDA 4537]MCP1986731.1 hypothetical protein [Bradyrhizobium sp. USDA 4539]
MSEAELHGNVTLNPGSEIGETIALFPTSCDWRM